MLYENFKETNKNSIHSELPKIAMLPKKHFDPLGVNMCFWKEQNNLPKDK